MSGKRKYFPNNWQKFKDAPSSMFHPHTFEEVMDWKIASWELPSNVNCVIREKNIKTFKVKEHVYQRQHAAEAKVTELLNKEDTEFTVCTSENIHFVSTHDIDHNDDDFSPSESEDD